MSTTLRAYMMHLFVGGCGLIGSVLVACAHFGAHVVGADIGWKVVHGKGIETHAIIILWWACLT